jgi:hypothetical protein
MDKIINWGLIVAVSAAASLWHQVPCVDLGRA